jgi:hypothetical protein
MIKFVCGCGKHLRARDDMASKRVFCPKCGSLVGIPSLQPTRPGGAGPMTPLERLRHARESKPLPPPEEVAPKAEAPEPPPPPPGGSRTVRLLAGKVSRRPDPSGQNLEKHWYQCLSYPLRAFRLCVGLALILTALSAAVAMLLPRLLAAPPEGPLALLAFHSTWALGILLIAGLPCSFLEAVMESASAGEVYYIRWSGNLPGTVVLGGVRWLVCFLAGPVFFAAAGVMYWLSCGDPAAIDWLILIELGLVAVGYQVYALLALTERGRLRDLNPVTVADLAHRLSWRGLASVLAAALLLLAHGAALLAAAPEVHHGALAGWLMLACIWASAVFWSTFFCRLLGIWCFRSRRAQPAEPG